MSPYSIQNFKPLEDMQILVDAMLPFAEVHSSRQHRSFYYTVNDESIIYLILKGTIFIHRLGDGMTVATGYAPLVIGLTNDILIDNGDYFFTAETEIIYAVISLQKAQEIIRDNELWKSLSKIQAYVMKYMSLHSAKSTALPAYEIICNLLRNLLCEPDEIRQHITAAQYIQERTRLSRSGIMRILSELKSGNYIRTSNGILVKIDKLPKKF